MSPIKWYQWGKQAIVSVPHTKHDADKIIRKPGYSISKATVSGKIIYECWKLPDIHMGLFDTANDAKEFIEGVLANSTV